MQPRSAARRNTRFLKSYPIRFGEKAAYILGFSVNLSSEGIMLTANRAFEPGTKLSLEIAPPEGRIKLKGEVRWCQKAKDPQINLAEFQMGVAVIRRNEKYLQLLKRIVQEDDDLFNYSHPISHPYSVTYSTQEQLIREYDENIRRNGIFIPTEETPPLNEVIAFTINLLEVMSVLHGRGKVIQRLATEQATYFGPSAGVCLEITDFTPEDYKLLKHYVNEVKGSCR